MWWVESLRQTQLSVLLTEPAPEMRSTSPHCSPQKSPHCYPLMRHLAGLPDNMSWTIVHRLHECRIIHMTSTHCELTCLLGARAGQPWARIEPAPLGVLAAHSSTEPPRPHSIVSKICSVWWSSALLCPGQASPGYQAGPAQATRPVRGRPHPATGSGFTLAYTYKVFWVSCQMILFSIICLYDKKKTYLREWQH